MFPNRALVLRLLASSFLSKLYYINSDIANAFVLPNGAVFLFHGLVNLLDHNEDALACVLAHEICHVVARHGAENLNWDMVVAFAEVRHCFTYSFCC